MTDAIIYHMCRAEEWRAALPSGSYPGSSQDRDDGFIHFSTASQIRESAAKHRAGQDGLLLLTVNAEALGDVLKWEESRGGALFPHLYAPLRLSDVKWHKALPWNGTNHDFPPEMLP